MSFQTTVGGKHGGYIGTRGRVHETTTDSRTRSAKPGDRVYVPLTLFVNNNKVCQVLLARVPRTFCCEEISVKMVLAR